MGKIVSVFLTLFLFVGNAYAASSTCSENKSQTDCQQAAKDFADSNCMWYSAQSVCYSSSCKNNKTETECKIAATAGKNYCVWFNDTAGHGRTGCYVGFYTSENCPSNAGFRLGCKKNEVIPYGGGVVACIPCPGGQIPAHNTVSGYEEYTRPFYITCQASTNVELPQKSVPWCSTDGSSKEQCHDGKYESCIDATYVHTQPKVINFYEFPSYTEGHNVVPGQSDGVGIIGPKVMCFLDLPSTNQSDKKQTFEGWLPYDDSNKKCPENTGSNYYTVKTGAEAQKTDTVLGQYKKPGYVAVFYYKKTNGTYALIGTVDQNGHTFNDMHSALSNSDITDIYVFWQPKKYCVTYGIKGTNVYSAKISKVCTYGEKCKIISAAVNENDYNTASGDFAVPPGSYISQWKTDDGKTTYGFGKDVPDLANPKNGEPAEWEAGSAGYYCGGTNAGLKLWPVIKKCEPGFYCPGENTYLDHLQCKAGATSDEGAKTKYNCYLSGYTNFCDKNGSNCFQISNLGDKKLYPVAN